MGGAAQASTYVALLRGVNVGGHGRLPMAELVGFLSELGATDVRTYIQSGNAVFAATAALAAGLAERLKRRIGDELGFWPDVMIRSAQEIRDLARSHPFESLGLETKFLHVVFLGAAPGPDAMARLDPDAVLPESILVRGHEVFVAYVNGSAHSKLNVARLGVPWTARNLRTVRKLSAMVSE